MRCHIRRCVAWVLWLGLGATVSLVLLMHTADEQLSELSQRSHDRKVPWGDTFHAQVKHIHGNQEHFGEGEPHVMLAHARSSSNVTASRPSRVSAVWPSMDKEEDRIVQQLDSSFQPVPNSFKKILMYNGGRNTKTGNAVFKENDCPIQQCLVTADNKEMKTADAVIFQGSSYPSRKLKNPKQVWVTYLLESPHHSRGLSGYSDVINWTATYRRDSTIVTPYEKFVHFKNFTKLPEKSLKDYAKGKTKPVAWFVSNCNAVNGRMAFVKELAKYIQVDVYGPCGEFNCPRSKANQCFEMLNKDYRFYLAFENSNCRDYITEKFYWNALWNEIVPVVMGAAPEDYRAVAPPHSYIHVDDFESPKALADYLHLLGNNNTLYNQYFRWKGTGEFINTKFMCRVCRMLHEADHHQVAYASVDNWWRGAGVCISPSKQGWATWRDHPEAVEQFTKAKSELKHFSPSR